MKKCSGTRRNLMMFPLLDHSEIARFVGNIRRNEMEHNYYFMNFIKLKSSSLSKSDTYSTFSWNLIELVFSFLVDADMLLYPYSIAKSSRCIYSELATQIALYFSSTRTHQICKESGFLLLSRASIYPIISLLSLTISKYIFGFLICSRKSSAVWCSSIFQSISSYVYQYKAVCCIWFVKKATIAITSIDAGRE